MTAANESLVIVEAPVDRLRVHPRNPRTITDKALDLLKRSLVHAPDMLRARPLVALPDGTVFMGNQRLKAAQELGWATIPTVYADLPPQEAFEWMLRDNNEFGESVDDQLAVLLSELQDLGSDLDLLGFDDDEMARLLSNITPVEFREYDESVESEVDWNECPECHHRWPK